MQVTSYQNIEFVNYRPEHYPELKAVMQLAYASVGAQYACEQEMNLLSVLYPEGQFVCLVNGILAGCVTTRIVPFAKYSKPHRLDQVADLNTFIEDAEIGDVVCGLDVVVHPNFRTLKLGTKLMQCSLNQSFKDNFPFYIGASRVANYKNYAAKMSLYTYVQNVLTGQLRDPALSFHLSYGARVIDLIYNFDPQDTESVGCGVVVVFDNPCYNASLPRTNHLQAG